jgi:GT2 family glycosyltransferase
MNAGPLVSVIIAHWNRKELLRACLYSLRRQTLAGAAGPHSATPDHGQPGALEVIVVDNGSTDGSPDMLATEFPEVLVIRNRENRGFCAANNQGIARAAGRYVALLNNDAEAHPRWLEALVREVEQASGVGMCASKILLYDDPGTIDKVGHLLYPDGQNRGRGAGQADHGQFDRVEEVLFPDGCAALYDRKVFDDAGMFDEDFFAYGDDAELGLRIRLAGWRCLYVPTAVVYHHHAATLGRFSPERLVLVERNRMWLATKLFPWRLLALNPVYCGLRWAANAWAAWQGRGEAGQAPPARLAVCALRATVQGLLGVPRMLRKRREIRRRLSDRDFLALLRRFRISLRELAFQSHTSPGPLPVSSSGEVR